MSTDPSGNMNFSEQLKKLRQNQFANTVVINQSSESKHNNFSFNASESSTKEEAKEIDDEYFTYKRHESFREHEDLSKTCFTKTDSKNNQTTIKRGLSALKNTNLIKKEENDETLNNNEKKGIQFFNNPQEKLKAVYPDKPLTNNPTKDNSPEYNRKVSEKHNDKEQDEYKMIKLTSTNDNDKVNFDELKQLYGASYENIINLLELIKEKSSVELEFSEAISSLKQHNNIEEVSTSLKDKVLSLLEGSTLSNDKMKIIAKNISKMFSKEKLEKMRKKKQKAYKLYLLNHYTESKYKRMTIFGLVLALVLAFIVAVTFSESLQKSLSDLLNNIPLDVEIN